MTKTAEKVAHEFRRMYQHDLGFEKLLAQALTAYADEIKEDRDRWADSACRLEKAQEKIKEQARAEALEEAAKLADSRLNVEWHIGDEIRALKAKP